MNADRKAAEPKRTWDDWPVCPQCRQPRQSVCPVCQVAGTDFPLTEYSIAGAPLRKPTFKLDACEPSATADNKVLLLCPTCEEVFTPLFYRCCQNCGHDFGRGIEIAPPEGDLAIPVRAVLVFLGITFLAGSLIFYFWLVLRH